MNERKTYLGDGVYIRSDGFGAVLTTETGVAVTNIIYLEPDVIEALVKWWTSPLGQAASQAATEVPS